MTKLRLITLLTLLATFIGVSELLAQDRHAGLYYPEPEIVENYTARSDTIPGVSRSGRVSFVVGFATAEEKLGYERPWEIFVKGAEEVMAKKVRPG